MKLAKLYIAIVIFQMGLIACNPKQVSQEELLKYVQNEENGLKKSIEIGDVKVSVTYKPNDLILAQELESNKLIDKNKIASLKTNFNKYYYFVLSFSKSNSEFLSGSSSRAEYEEHLQTILYGMKDYVTLLGDGADTLLLLDYVYPRMYGTSVSTDLLFAFEKGTKKKYDNLLFNLEDFGLRIGTNKFIFETDDIEKVPQLQPSNN